MNIEDLNKTWDLIIIGGGITGAGVLREAVRMGLKTLLLEKYDFAWGTSGRSSKLVHGGLRYLKQGRLQLMRESIHQRQRLIAEAPGLVEELDILLPVYKNKNPGRLMLTAGLTLYDIMAGRRRHTYYDAKTFASMAPGIEQSGLAGGFSFMDAQTDDARLVLRLIDEAVDAGGTALNYCAVTRIVRNDQGMVSGIEAKDTETGQSAILNTSAVINATGAWAETLHPSHRPGRHLRPLRGSHLVIGAERITLSRAVTLSHPDDKRPLFIIPWEGALILGTTDLDHGSDIHSEITATEDEARYMLECLNAYFPEARITPAECIASFAGIRPVMTEKEGVDPSKESREHVTWTDKGLVTITGGKLTTFRILAADALKAALPFLPVKKMPSSSTPAFAPVSVPSSDRKSGGNHLEPDAVRRLYGRYGDKAGSILEKASGQDLVYIPGTRTLWAELPAAAETGRVRHLTDLLLRRVRIGLLLEEGGSRHLDRIQALCEPFLPWDKSRWKDERQMYTDYWHETLRVPGK